MFCLFYNYLRGDVGVEVRVNNIRCYLILSERLNSDLVVAVFAGTQVVQLVDGTTFPTSGYLVLGWLQPHDDVGTCWGTGTTDVSVVIIGVDHNWVGHGTLSGRV